ncbi:kinase-like domain-containing protein [Rhizophagus diaphanus]|nr:kinase-like domain-containing protein [Rhizophagus diaphanus] [Rhizophagus sp. MUCL 43196]
MSETAAPKKKAVYKRMNKAAETAVDGAEPVVNTLNTICAGVEAAANVAVPFANFLPLIGEVSRLLKDIVDIYQTAEHNKRICGVMLDRVTIAESAIKNLKVRREENEDFFSEENYINLQKLVTVVSKIRKFLAEISQLKGLQKYIQAKNIEKTTMDLNKEFDFTIQLLEFAFMVDFSARNDIDNKKIKADIEDLTEYLQVIGGGLTDTNKNVSDLVVQLSVLNKTIMDKTETNIFQNELLPYNDFDETEVDENIGKKIKKFKRIKNGINDFVALKLVADESSNEEAKNNIKNQVTILRKLEECHNIIQFFGLTTTDGNKWFLVTEWAEYGNLREFYNTYGPLDVKVKLLFALDISRGLNFLRAVEIVHRDIRAENILITDHQTAKIANFNSSRAVTDVTKNHKTTLECVRYCAPEKLERLGSQTKYDTKSEIYSFGILLWEIAEEKVPYADYKDIMAITELVGEKKYREPFSEVSPLPKEYQDIAKKAVDHDPNYRPSFTRIFTVLQELYSKKSRPPPSPRINSSGSNSPSLRRQGTIDSFKLSEEEEDDIMILPNFSDFNYMTVDEAAKQHKLPDGNRELAYKCFDAYSDLGDMKAKYFKAYYIQQKYFEVDMDANEKDQLIANLFKEVADSGDEYPEAQLRYGNCLIKGIGVKKNLKEAAIYFTKAAENGQVVGMFNAASLYFSGGAGKKDPKLGEKYMKLAAYKQHAQAIEYCKKNNIQL